MNIETKLEYWKKKLLDLGKRNKLIQSPYPRSNKRVSRTCLLFEEPGSDMLWNTFSEQGGSIDFSYEENTFEETFSGENSENSEVKSDEKFSNGIKTNQSISDTIKTLILMMKKSRDFIENKGMNALYLSFGFLYWKENGEQGADLRSPLLLVPVALSQENIAEPIYLTRLDDDIVVNQSLLQKMKVEYGLQLPEFQDGQELNAYFDSIRDICKKFSWEVQAGEVQLSMYSFLKMAMYHDVEKNAEKIIENPIICALNGDIHNLDIQNTDLQDISSFNHDSVDPSMVFSILDADSSQQDAILLAKKGVSFVLQGPPGTGKSQTITNIIAELIAKGKKVLFVSEKMAALQVVYRRLQQCGLGDFCLTLHNPNAKRKDILDQLYASMQLSKSKAVLQTEASNHLNELNEVRNVLNQYAKDLHTPVAPLGKTIYDVNGRLAKLVGYPNVQYIQPGAGEFTENRFFQCENTLKEITRIVKESGYQKENPWAGSRINSITYEFRQTFLVNANTLTKTIAEGEELSEILFQKIGKNNCKGSFSELGAFIDFCIVCTKSAKIPGDWIELPLDLLCQACQLCPELIAKRARLVNLIENFTQYGAALKKAACELTKYTDEKDGTIPSEKFSEYNDIHNNYTSIFIACEVDPLFEQEQQFRKSVENFIEKESAYRQKTSLYEEKNSLYTVTAKALDSEQKILVEKQKKLEELKSPILTIFNENIFEIDAETILFRFKSEYNTPLRFFNSQYRNDSKTLKNHSIDKTKKSYAQAVDLLEKIFTAQQAQLDTNKQAIRTENAFSLKAEISADLSVCLNEQEESMKELENAKKLLHNCLNSLLDEYTKACHTYQKNASSILENIDRNIAELQSSLKIPVSEKTDFDALTNKLEWAYSFQRGVRKYEIENDFVKAVCNAEPWTAQIKEDAERLQKWLDNAGKELPLFTDLFSDEYQEKFRNMPLQQLSSCINNCKEHFSSLEYLIDYRNAKKVIQENGLGGFLAEIERLEIAHDKIIPVFEKCFYHSWLDEVLPKFSSIEGFRRKRQDERIEDFQHLDKLSMKIAQASLKVKMISAMPNFDNALTGGSEISLLRKEMAKKRKLMPLRKLIAEIPSLLPVLKPCILMSPLSVSTYFGESDYEFDTVIFDEASQVRTEDAVCSIFRAKQVIIAGDSKQLPPTDFFSTSVSEPDTYEETEDGEVDDTGAYESLLDEASVLPTQTLLWHYRSKHEALIAFSNLKIYGGNLITFPSSVEKSKDMGVSYIHVEDGVYERTGDRGNRKEAEIIANMVFAHFKNHPDRSIGIIAFGEVQQNMIESVIMRKRHQDLTFENFFSSEREEPFFIKNLETVQGDERDTIIFSIGYAKDASGKFIMNFGPLSRVGGERRLNVAITRARYQLKLVGSIMPTDINTDKISGIGPKLLRDYIDFAIRGEDSLLAQTKEEETVWFDSPFEEAVYNFITANGYDVKTQVGCSGYRIDMAVRHPKYNGRFVLGIECDGASYHSARTARERDRLRQTILENMGWKFYRIWSTDWIKDSDSEGKRLLNAISRAIDEYHEPEPLSEENESENFLQISEKTQDEPDENTSDLCSDYYGNVAQEIPIPDIEKTMLKIIERGFGYTKDELFDDVARYGYGWKRKGKTIIEHLNKAYDVLLRKRSITEENGKIKLLQT